MVTQLIADATHRIVEPEFAQLIALFVAWRQDIDSEPFAYENDWATVDSPALRVVASWPSRQQPPGPPCHPLS